MRLLTVPLALLILLIPAAGQTSVTVGQLEQFLTSPHTRKLSDDEIARRLNRAELSEQLTNASLARIITRTNLGPKATEQLEIISAASLFEGAPTSDLPPWPAPNVIKQQQMLQAARSYVSGELRLLPDLLAIRVTRSFDNVPTLSGKKRGKQIVQMHFVREYRNEIAVRSGREVIRTIGEGDRVGQRPAPAGLSSWGEFGAILTIALSDSFSGNLEWSRWQRSETGKPIAVFRYRIPRLVSHYTVDFCCYRKSQDDPTLYPFHEKPAYAGEIYIDAESGKINRITVQAELSQDDPVTKSAIAVQYGDAIIDGKRYSCPIRSVAISELHNRAIEKIDGIGLERHLNEERFDDYHKFGSTMRIVTGTVAGLS